MDALRQLDAAAWEALLSFCDRAHFTLLLSDLPAGRVVRLGDERIA